jgi:peptide/nickel transport system substrate-binding protein
MHKTWRASDVVIVLLLVAACVMMYLQINQADRNNEQLMGLVKRLAADAGAGQASTLNKSGPGVTTVAPQPAAVPGASTAEAPSVATPPAGEKAKMGDWLIRCFNAEPRTLNPITYKDYYAAIALGYMFDALMDRNPETLEWRPRLAESWVISPDHLTITFKMRKGMQWSDGEPITADDAVFSYQTIVDPQVDNARGAGEFKDIASVKALDERTVEFKFKKPYFLSFEVCGGMTIIPRHVYQYTDAKKFNEIRDKLVGSGPYVFEEWKPGQEISLRRNPRYYGKPAYCDRMVFKIVLDDITRYQKTKAQEIDRVGLTAQQYIQMADDEKFLEHYKRLKYPTPESGYSYIGWNELSELFQDARVRRALTMLVPRERMKKEIFQDQVEIATGPFWPGAENIKIPTQADPTIKPWPFDPKQALLLLSEAGWRDTDGSGVLKKNGRAFAFKLMIPTGGGDGLAIAKVIREEMAKVGIDVTVMQLEWSVFEGKLDSRDFETVMLGWSGGIEGDPYSIWHSDGIANMGSNHISFRNAEADRLIMAARVEFDPVKRNEMYRQFHRLLHEEQPYTFLFRSQARAAVHKRFEDVKIHPLGLDDSEWWVPAGQRLYTK